MMPTMTTESALLSGDALSFFNSLCLFLFRGRPMLWRTLRNYASGALKALPRIRV
jgi:hypothetical protein